jgi:flagellar biosynthesis anti-sigma factor FlgM
MKIDSGAAQQAYASAARLGAANRAGAATGASKAPGADESKVQGSDSVQISTQGRLRSQALDAVQGSPETRSKLVMELRSQIKMGTFAVDDASLAHKIAQHIDIRA